MRLLPKKVSPTRALVEEVGAAVLREQHDEIEKLKREIGRLQSLEEDQIRGLAELLIQAWLGPSRGPCRKVFFDDPVWGNTYVDEELTELFFHPLIQRLNHIKQLSFAYLTFPNATHSRLAHSLGTCRNLEVSLTTIFRNNLLYKKSGAEPIQLDAAARGNLVLKARAAALLHDVGHAPFGHALDKLIGYFDPTRALLHPDKVYSDRYLREHLRGVVPKSVDVENLAAIMRQDVTLSGWDLLVADLLDSPLDADRMDYLARDAHMTGLSMGVTAVEALMERMCPFEEDGQIFLTFEASCVPYVEDFLLAREKMYGRCYEHPSKLAAERIFTRLVEGLLRDHGLRIDQIMLLTDEQVLALLGLAAVGSEENSELLYALLRSVEYEAVLEVDLNEKSHEVEQWNSYRIKPRMGRMAYVEWPREREKMISAAAGLGENGSWRVLVTIPDQRTGVPNESKVQILERNSTEGYRLRPLFEVAPQLLGRLKDAHKPRGKIRVLADRRLAEQQKKEIEQAARDILSKGPNG